MKAYPQRSQELIVLLDRACQEKEVQIKHKGQIFILKKVSSPLEVGDIGRPDITADEIVNVIHESRRNVRQA
ncbi:MAG: hypothetical protein DRR19_12110 [Candidatus Parabeggiatoa sp. nov. 1]|nr:MAG: hypothetical protein DRR19_12110 [Gammaproteobacteria bacterium]